MEIKPCWLEPSWYIDSDDPAVDRFCNDAVDGATNPTEMAVRLFHAVRDGFRYDPYTMSRLPADYRASAITTQPTGWCVPKSVLLTAAARNRGIPARLGFADVRNHLTSEKLRAEMGTDLFAWHGYAELVLEGRWFKLSTAFNIELCERFGVKVLDFDGTDDAMMHAFDTAGNRHMEYVNERGSFDDLPLDEIFDDFGWVYPNWFGDEQRGTSAAEAGDSAFE